MLKWDMNCMVFKNKKGSITLDCAIVFSVVLILITIFITAMNVQKTDIYMQAAIEQSTEDMACLTPFSRLGDAVLNSLSSDEDIGEDVKAAYKAYNDFSDAFSDLSGFTLEDLIMNGMLSTRIRNNIATEFVKRNGGSNLYTPETINVVLTYNSEQNVIEEYVFYSVNTVFGDVERTHYSIIPFYGVLNSEITSSTKVTVDNDGVNPWELGNFERGQYFSEKYGANLPKTFPVIDGFENGVAKSIVSIDLTADTYNSDKKIISKVSGRMEELETFEGADVCISGKRYVIDASEIKDKELIIIIPENTPEERCEVLTNFIDSYSNEDFNVTIVKNGESK